MFRSYFKFNEYFKVIAKGLSLNDLNQELIDNIKI